MLSLGWHGSMATDIHCDHRKAMPPGQAHVCLLGRFGGLVTDGMCRRCIRDGLNADIGAPSDEMDERVQSCGRPGTELKAILRDWLGVTATPTCPCNAHALQMDRWGPDECERRIEEIVDWLGEEAARRSLPFVRFAARKMVRLAIARARRTAR